jgi:prevent-host-death family protein
MLIGIHEAKTHFSRLIPAVLAGEEVIITKSGEPIVKLLPVHKKLLVRQLGLFKDKIKIHGDLTEKLPPEVIADFWPEKL